MKKNYKICLNYSIDELNETIQKDKENYNRYIIYQNRFEVCEKIREKNYNICNIDTVKLNIKDSNIIEILKKIKEEQVNITNEYNITKEINTTDEYNNTEEIKNNINELNEFLNNLCEETFTNKFNFINETEILLNCDKNSYYLNYFNLTYFDNFEKEISNKLSNNSLENKEAIISFYVGGQLIDNFLSLNDYIKLENYTDFSIMPFKFNLENFQYMAEYINYKKEKKYKDFLIEAPYNAFNLSFTEFMENSISGDIEDKLLIYILGKIDINVNCIEEKVQNEKGYYSLLLNKTKELGITSVNAFISLYDYLSDRVNKTLRYQIEDYISDNIIFFFRENKYIFRDIFFNYYLKNSNSKFGIENIFKLKTFLEELKFNLEFNKTLENISKSLWAKLIDKINNNLNNKLNTKVEELSDFLKTQQNEIKKDLENIKIVELYENMLLLAEMIYNYTIIVNEQNNRFKFLVSDLPLGKFGFFSQNYLEPPLDEIKQ